MALGGAERRELRVTTGLTLAELNAKVAIGVFLDEVDVSLAWFRALPVGVTTGSLDLAKLEFFSL